MDCCGNCIKMKPVVLPKCLQPDTEYPLTLGTLVNPTVTNFTIYVKNTSNDVKRETNFTLDDISDPVVTLDLALIADFINPNAQFEVWIRPNPGQYAEQSNFYYEGYNEANCIILEFVLTNDTDGNPTSIINQTLEAV